MFIWVLLVYDLMLPYCVILHAKVRLDCYTYLRWLIVTHTICLHPAFTPRTMM